MKITKIETIRLEEFPNILLVLVHTDEGLSGLGETFYGARAVEAYLHESVANSLLGEDPLRIDANAESLRGYLGYGSSGVETPLLPGGCTPNLSRLIRYATICAPIALSMIVEITSLTPR